MIDTEFNVTDAMIPLGNGWQDAAPNSDGTRCYVARAGRITVSSLGTDATSSKDIVLGRKPFALSVVGPHTIHVALFSEGRIATSRPTTRTPSRTSP